MATTVARLQAVLSADTKNFDAKMAESEGKTRGFSKGVTRAALYAGAGVVLGLGKAVSAAANFEQSLNTLQAVTGVTGEQLSKFRSEAIKLGADTKLPATSASDAALAMTELAKAGLSVKNTMAAARPVLVLSAAAGIDNAQAAEIAANALNAFHLKGKDAALVADQLANVANASSVEITDASDSFKMAAAVFAGFQSPVLGAKGAMTELNVAIGILGNAGIKGSDAGTSLKQALLQLTGPSQKAKAAMQAVYLSAQGAKTGQDDMTTALRGTSKEANEAIGHILKLNPGMAKAGDIAYTSSGKMRSLKDIVRLTYLGTKDLTQEQRNNAITTIFGSDATRSIIALMKAGAPAWDKMTKAVEKRGAAENLAAAKMKGFKGTVEAAKSALETLEIVIGTGLLPILTALAGAFAKVANAAAAHKTVTQVLIGVVSAFAAIVLTTNLYLKIMASQFVTKVIPAIVKTTAVQWLLNTAFLGFPLIWLVAAFAAVGVAFYVLWKKSETFRDIIKGSWEAIKVATQTIWNAIKLIVRKAIDVLVFWFKNLTLAGLIIGHWHLIVDKTKDIFGGLVGFFKELPGRIGDAIVSGAKALKEAVTGLFGKVIDWVKGALGIGSPSKVFHEIGRNVIHGFINGVGSMAGVLKDAVVHMVTEAASHIPGNPFGIGRHQSGAGEVGKLPGEHSRGSAERYLVPWAHREGITVTSVATGQHAQGSYHYKHRAIDVAGSPSAMRKFFYDSIAHFGGKNITELFYDPIGAYIKNGAMKVGSIGGHSDHVHIALGEGGIVTRAMNALIGERGREAVIPLDSPQGRQALNTGDIVIPVYLGGEHVGTVLFDMVRRQARSFQGRNARPAFGGA